MSTDIQKIKQQPLVNKPAKPQVTQTNPDDIKIYNNPNGQTTVQNKNQDKVETSTRQPEQESTVDLNAADAEGLSDKERKNVAKQNMETAKSLSAAATKAAEASQKRMEEALTRQNETETAQIKAEKETISAEKNVTSAQKGLKSAETNRDNLKSSLTQLKSQLSGAPDEQKASIQEQITAKEAELSKAEEEIKKAKEQLSEAEKGLETAQLNEKEAKLNAQEAKKECELAERELKANETQAKSAKDTYDKAKEKYDEINHDTSFFGKLSNTIEKFGKAANVASEGINVYNQFSSLKSSISNNKANNNMYGNYGSTAISAENRALMSATIANAGSYINRLDASMNSGMYGMSGVGNNPSIFTKTAPQFTNPQYR